MVPGTNPELFVFCFWKILYSGKFLLVQNFAELPPNLSEEIFMVLIFTLSLFHMYDVPPIFAVASPLAKTTKFAPCENFPLYRSILVMSTKRYCYCLHKISILAPYIPWYNGTCYHGLARLQMLKRLLDESVCSKL